MNGRRLKIAFYGLNYWPEVAGIGPYTTELAEHLEQQGHDVSVVTAFPHYPQWAVAAADARVWRRRETVRNVAVTRLWTRIPKPMSGLRRTIFEFSYLASALVTGPGRADIVVGVIPGLGSGLAAAFHGKLRRRRVVMIVQDLAGQGLMQSGLSSARVLGVFAQSAERLALRSAQQIIAISEAFVAPLVANGVPADRITVLPNWVRSGAPTTVTRADHEPPVILHAGSMGIKQGLDQVLSIARVAHQRGLAWRFRMVGDGSERARLQASAADLPNVEFADPVRDEEFSDLLASADVLLLVQAPSNIDMSFPSKLASYFAAHRPVVAVVPPNGAVAGVFAAASPGVCLANGDPAGVVDELEAMLRNPEARVQMAERGAEYATKHWGRAGLVSQWAAAVLGSVPAPEQG